MSQKSKVDEPTMVKPTIVEATMVQPTMAKLMMVTPTMVKPSMVKPTMVTPTMVEPTMVEMSMVELTVAVKCRHCPEFAWEVCSPLVQRGHLTMHICIFIFGCFRVPGLILFSKL